MTGQSRSDEQALVASSRQFHARHRGGGAAGAGLAVQRRERAPGGNRQRDRDRPAVLSPGRPRVAPGRAGRDPALAAASDHPRRHLRGLPAARPGAAPAVGHGPGAAALCRPAVSLHLALGRAVVGGVHLDRRRQRSGGAVQRLAVERRRHGADAAAGRPAAAGRGRAIAERRGHRRHAPAVAVPGRAGPAALARRLAATPSAGGRAWSIAPPSC